MLAEGLLGWEEDVGSNVTLGDGGVGEAGKGWERA